MEQSATEIPVRDESFGGDLHDAALLRRGCCRFFNFPCFEPKRSDNWERISTPNETVKRNWWAKVIDTLKKVREWSELVAGPKWKTFIRRFNKGGGSRAKAGKFQYDPSSYSLNFDEGQGRNWDADSDLIFRDFSSRYTAIPVQNVLTKDSISSM